MSNFDPVIEDQFYDPDYPASTLPVVFESYGSKLLGTMFRSAGAGQHPVIILLHGFPGYEVSYDLAHVFQRQGFNVLVFHYRGCLGSGGDYLWKNLVEDVPNSINFMESDYAQEKFGNDPDKIILMGHSMGGFAALYNSIQFDEIKYAASLAGFNAGLFGGLIESNKPVYEFSAQHLRPSMDFVKCDSSEILLNELITYKNEWNLLNHIEKLKEKNLLIIGAKNDSTTPLEIHHQPLINSLKTNNAKNVKDYILETGYSLADKRIELARIVSNWLNELNNY
ncbi:MAG: alpha/beta fold hydrolase [Ignavibacteriales bacterium]|nr:alpha/beta fold hydrolase [Ignavibacteriales bacterium]